MRWYLKNEPESEPPEWSRWFAWHPVNTEMGDGRNAVVWFEWVERKEVGDYAGSTTHRHREIIPL